MSLFMSFGKFSVCPALPVTPKYTKYAKRIIKNPIKGRNHYLMRVKGR